MPAAIRPVAVEDIKKFFDANTRAENDATNRIREAALTLLGNPTHPFFSDAEFGTQWTKLQEAFVNYVKLYLSCPTLTRFVLEQKGGQKNHHDFIFSSYENDLALNTVIIEFKNNSMPQFMQEFDKNGWTAVKLAEWWYDNGWLDRIIELYPQPLKYPKPTRKDYLKGVNQLLDKKSKPSFFKQFYEFDRLPEYKEQYDKKALISQEGIAAFLAEHGSTFDVVKLREKCQLEQTSKKYCIFNRKKVVFDYDKITVEELSPSAITRVTDNTVVLKSGPSELHCLLRWKNTLGICNPAWQISLRRVPPGAPGTPTN